MDAQIFYKSTEQTFVKGPLSMLQCAYRKHCKKNQNKVKTVFDVSMKWHLIEGERIESFTELPEKYREE